MQKQTFHIDNWNLRWIFGDLSLVGWHVGNVSLVQPLDSELAVHVGGRFAQPLLLMLLQRVLHVHRKQVPDGGRGELKSRLQISDIGNQITFASQNETDEVLHEQC